MAKKQEQAAAMDPNRFKIAKNMTTMPGGPMNNNPMNVTSVGAQPGSMSGVNQFPYGDSGLANAPQMGADILNPRWFKTLVFPRTCPWDVVLTAILPSVCRCSQVLIHRSPWKACVWVQMQPTVVLRQAPSWA